MNFWIAVSDSCISGTSGRSAAAVVSAKKSHGSLLAIFNLYYSVSSSPVHWCRAISTRPSGRKVTPLLPAAPAAPQARQRQSPAPGCHPGIPPGGRAFCRVRGCGAVPRPQCGKPGAARQHRNLSVGSHFPGRDTAHRRIYRPVEIFLHFRLPPLGIISHYTTQLLRCREIARHFLVRFLQHPGWGRRAEGQKPLVGGLRPPQSRLRRPALRAPPSAHPLSPLANPRRTR